MKALINQISFCYEITGSKGVPVVLLHGFGLNRSIWLPFATKYLGDQRVILPDLRGHGETDATAGLYRMSMMAEDVVNLLEFLGVRKAIICGHSMGGYVSLAFAEHYPHRIAGLGLITTRAASDTAENQRGRYEMVEAVRNNGSAALAENLASRLTADANLASEIRTILLQASPDGFTGALLGMASRSDRSSLLPGISVPSLVVAGEKDEIIAIDEAKVMADALPDGLFLSLPNAGHMPMLETPEELAGGLVKLIKRVEAVEK